MRPALRARDWFWVALAPVYALLGTLRHEGCHAIVGMLSGAHLKKLVFWPSIYEGQSFWGYVLFDPPRSSLWISAAPYLCDVLLVPFMAWITIRFLAGHRKLWIQVTILGIVLPIVDSEYNYLGWAAFRSGSNDLAEIATHVPPWSLHIGFGIAALVFAASLLAALQPRKIRDAAEVGAWVERLWWVVVGIEFVVLLGTIAIDSRRLPGFDTVSGSVGLGAGHLARLAILLFPLLVAAVVLRREASRREAP